MVGESNTEIARDVMEESDSIELDIDEETPDSDSGDGSEDGSIDVWERVTNSSYSKDLNEMETVWDPQNGGPTRIKRGVINLGDLDSLAVPLVDIPLGIAETAYLVHSDKFNLHNRGESENENESSSQEALDDEESKIRSV